MEERASYGRPRHLAEAYRDPPEYVCVRRWPGMRAEAKYAWWDLWRMSNGGREAIVVNATVLAELQGVTSDAGRKRLKDLAQWGLIQSPAGGVAEPDSRGVWTISLPDPREIARARQIKWDGQQELPFAREEGASFDEGNGGQRTTSELPTTVGNASVRHAAHPAPAEDPPEVPPEDPPAFPRRATFHFQREKISLNQTSTSETLDLESGSAPPLEEVYRSIAQARRGSSGGSSADSGGGRRLDELAQGIERRLVDQVNQALATAPAQEQEVERLVARIVAVHAAHRWQRGPNPDNLNLTPCLKVAWAIVEGNIARADLDALLVNLRKAQAAGFPHGGNASSYLCGGFKRMFRDAGLDWSAARRSSRSTSKPQERAP